MQLLGLKLENKAYGITKPITWTGHSGTEKITSITVNAIHEPKTTTVSTNLTEKSNEQRPKLPVTNRKLDQLMDISKLRTNSVNELDKRQSKL